MDFLEDLFDFGDRRRGRDKGGRGDHDDHDHKAKREVLVCTKCSNPVISGAKFCSNCGGEISAQAFCVKCGTKLMVGSAFCHECGIKAK